MKKRKIDKFKVVEKNNNSIILQEENDKNRFFLFWMRNKKSIIISLSMILSCILLVILGISLSLFRGSNDYDITYIVGDEDIIVNPDNKDDEDIKDDILGEIAREEGIVLLTETVMTSGGDVISFFTDKSAIVVTAQGKIYRISSDAKGEYGIDKNGKIDETAVKILVTSTTTTLSDGTVITNYSDGTAKVELKGNTIFVRDSNNVELLDGSCFVKANPSGVSLAKNISRVNRYYINKFTDDTTFISVGNKKYIVNKNNMPVVVDGAVNLDKNNAFESISEKTYADGYTINHYTNGSATITDKNGNMFFVRKSGDLVLKKKKLYEIIPNDKGYSRKDIESANKTVVTYFDNGAAVVTKPDGDKEYVEDATQIVYDDNKNINDSYVAIPMIGKGITDEGHKVYNFGNGKSQVVNKKGSSYIVDTESLDFKPITDDEVVDEEEGKENENGETDKDLAEGIFISEAENIYNEFKNIENTKFIIKNNNTSSRTLRIAIEEVSDYDDYDTSRLDPKYVKFQATIGDAYVPSTMLSANAWVDSDDVTNYIIYDGVIGAKQSVGVTLALYVDYSLLNNSHQNKGFVGTIRIYVDSEV